MATAVAVRPLGWLADEVRELKSSWGWFVGLGVVLIVLGMIAIGSAALMTLASVLFFGWLLIIGGLLEAAYAVWQKRWSCFFLDLLTGILYLVAGFMMVANPAATAVALTLLIAMFLLFEGIIRILTSVAVRPPHWVWVAAHGVISLLLGIAIWRGWPLSGMWVIGLFVGIEMLFNGWSLVMLGLMARKLPEQGAPA
jgi:uncharacterized membrane protein HdeD (DUF308 family)